MVLGLLGSAREREAVARLYLRLVEQARLPAFYAELGVPDTPVGRYELAALHVWLALRRLRTGGLDDRRFAQKLFDYMFADLDLNLREMGVGDLSVGKKVKALAKGLYGRMRAYDAGLEMTIGPDALGEALRRNLLGMAEAPSGAQVAALAAYVRAAEAILAASDTGAVRAGAVAWPEVPAPAEAAEEVGA